MRPAEFGYVLGNLLEKNAGGLAAGGKMLGNMLGSAAKAAPTAPAARVATKAAPLATRAAQTAGAAGTGAVAASQTPAGQNAMQTASNVATAVPSFANRAIAAFQHNPLGHQLGHQWHNYEKMVEPFDRAGMSSVVEMPMQLAEGAHRLAEPVHEFMPGVGHAGMGGH